MVMIHVVAIRSKAIFLVVVCMAGHSFIGVDLLDVLLLRLGLLIWSFGRI